MPNIPKVSLHEAQHKCTLSATAISRQHVAKSSRVIVSFSENERVLNSFSPTQKVTSIDIQETGFSLSQKNKNIVKYFSSPENNNRHSDRGFIVRSRERLNRLEVVSYQCVAIPRV